MHESLNLTKANHLHKENFDIFKGQNIFFAAVICDFLQFFGRQRTLRPARGAGVFDVRITPRRLASGVVSQAGPQAPTGPPRIGFCPSRGSIWKPSGGSTSCRHGST
jgi:hypothetical protein